MKTNIRSNVFETNSSSVHTITISNTSPQGIDNYIFFDRGEYGWEWEIYNSSQDKANYLYECMIDLFYHNNSLEEKCNRIREELASYKVDCDFAEVNGDNIFDGYVDHGSQNEELVNYLLDNPDKLIDYLFNDTSYIATGNDNVDSMYCTWENSKPTNNEIQFIKWN